MTKQYQQIAHHYSAFAEGGSCLGTEGFSVGILNIKLGDLAPPVQSQDYWESR